MKTVQFNANNILCGNNYQCEPIVNYINNTFIITDIYSG